MDMFRDKVRMLHYSRRTEQAYGAWIKQFIYWSGMRHPRTMGAAEVEEFLSFLATHRNVSAGTQNQARAALLFPNLRQIQATARGVGDKRLTWNASKVSDFHRRSVEPLDVFDRHQPPHRLSRRERQPILAAQPIRAAAAVAQTASGKPTRPGHHAIVDVPYPLPHFARRRFAGVAQQRCDRGVVSAAGHHCCDGPRRNASLRADPALLPK
jgi:Phage integrase, N-terminal SAM-like domain